MTSAMPRYLTSELLFKVLFHSLFWGAMVGLPLLVRPQFLTIRHEYLYLHIGFILITNLILFFANTELLVPKIFARKGPLWYFLCLIIIVFFYARLVIWLGRELLPHLALNPKVPAHFPFAAPLILVTAISTAYGLIVHYSQQEKRKQAQEEEHLRSELLFLRSQISPHFIFNVLNSLNYLIHKNSPEAKTVVVKLAELMRYMLYESDDTRVLLTKEIEYLKNYIDLQRIRFGNDIRVQTQISLPKHHYLIEPMLLIPFVENAFKHGVSLVDTPFIEITIEVDYEGWLLMTVVNKINPQLTEKKDADSGIGLRNVQRRLQLLYPSEHQLSVNQTETLYQITLQIKLRHA
jgi:two-component system, LytTR family, sensor kinase